MSERPIILLFGAGYSACAFAASLAKGDYEIWGTCRSADKFEILKKSGINPLLFDGAKGGDIDQIKTLLNKASYLLSSIKPDGNGDPVLHHFHKEITAAKTLRWIAYLSTIGVYGNFDGAWVDETTKPRPKHTRALNRQKAEQNWLALYKNHQQPVHIFRLGGIYGKGRGPLEKIKQGTARCIIKDGQYFNRIHAKDIALCLIKSMDHITPGEIYNLVDDKPANPVQVMEYAATLLEAPMPPTIDFIDANLSPMVRSFYSDNRRVTNTKIKDVLGVCLNYPTYKEGLKALLNEANN